MRHNLMAGECERAEEVELTDNPYHLSVTHNWKSIEVVFLE
jgi:hypothetical protein